MPPPPATFAQSEGTREVRAAASPADGIGANALCIAPMPPELTVVGQFGGADIPVCSASRADKNVRPTKLTHYRTDHVVRNPHGL